MSSGETTRDTAVSSAHISALLLDAMRDQSNVRMSGAGLVISMTGPKTDWATFFLDAAVRASSRTTHSVSLSVVVTTRNSTPSAREHSRESMVWIWWLLRWRLQRLRRLLKFGIL